jgi:uncharacterized membrane protein YfcA
MLDVADSVVDAVQPVLETYQFVLLGITVFVAALFQAFTGFGFALISTPILFLFVDEKYAVLALTLPGLIAAIAATSPLRRDIPWKPVGFYVLWAPLGLVLGAYALDGVPPEALKVVLALLLAHVLVGKHLPGLLNWLHWPPLSGTLAGIAAGALGTAGPPVVAWAHARDEWSLVRRRAATLAVFVILGVARLPVYGAMGMLSDGTLWVVAAGALPVIVGGSATGSWLAKRVSEKTSAIILRLAIVGLIITLISSIFTGR